jgi:hypothetical protein
MDMDKFTKYAIYFLVGILAYYLLFNNGLVEGFTKTSEDKYQFTVAAVTGDNPVASVDVTLSRKTAISTTDIPKFNKSVPTPADESDNTYNKYTLCQNLLKSITHAPVATTTEESRSIFYKFSEPASSGFTYVMLNYTKPWVAPSSSGGTCDAAAWAGTETECEESAGTCADADPDVSGTTTKTLCDDAANSAGTFTTSATYVPSITYDCTETATTSVQEDKTACDVVADLGTAMVCEAVKKTLDNKVSACTYSPVGSCTYDGTETKVVESACGFPLDPGVYILKYPNTLGVPDTNLNSMIAELDKIEIYKTDNLKTVTISNSATLKKMEATADDFKGDSKATLKIKGKCSTNPCHGHGVCSEAETTIGYTCACAHGYSGTDCSTADPKPYTCPNGTAVTGNTSGTNTTNCAICNTGFYKTTDPNPKCLPVGTCISFDESKCETGDSKNASKTCEKPTCDKTDCCEDNFSIEIGVILGIIICIGLIIGAFYVFSSRSRHKAAHKVLSGKEAYTYK